MKKLLFVIWLACLAVGFSARGQVPAPNHTVVRFNVMNAGTNYGTLDIELFDQEKPETVRNFLMYVYSGAYSNLVLHTLVRNSILEAGHIRVDDPASTNTFFTYPLWEDFGFITNEYSVGPELSNNFGTIAMVRFPGQTNSASFEWFINLTNNPSFNTNDGGTTVFGRVVNTTDARSGTNLLNHFNNFSSDQLEFVSFIEYSEFLFFLPVTMARTDLPRISDLFTVQPTFLQGGMPRDGGAPTVQIIEPPDQLLESSNITMRFSGTASDNQEVARVLYDSGAGRSVVANGRESWNADVRLGFGTNKVAVRSVDYFGNKSAAVERTVYNPFAQLGLTIRGKGKVFGATNGQLLRAGATNRFQARPAPGWYFVAWTGDLFSRSPVIEFITDDFVADGSLTNVVAVFGKTFLGLSNGIYQGIFTPLSNGPAHTAGWISLNLNPRGQYTGSLKPIGANYRIGGFFSGPDGTSTIHGTVGTNRLILDLRLIGAEAIFGWYHFGNLPPSWVTLYRVQKYSKARPTPLAGTYSFLMSPTVDLNTATGDGYGFGSVTIDASGKIKMTGTLGDEIAIKQTAKLLKDNYWPFYATVNKGKEAVLGIMRFDTNSSQVVFTNDVKWWAPHFPGGTNQNVRLAGARYTSGVPLNWTNGVLTLMDEELEGPLTADVRLEPNGSITVLSNTNGVQFSVPDARGHVTGSFTHPISSQVLSLRGGTLQSSNIIGGSYGTGTNNGGFIIQRRP